MIRVLLIDDDQGHAQRLMREMCHRGVMAIEAVTVRDGAKRLKFQSTGIDIVILVISDPSQPWLEILSRLQESCWQASIGELPVLLCVIHTRLRPELLIQVENLGARHVIEW